MLEPGEEFCSGDTVLVENTCTSVSTKEESSTNEGAIEHCNRRGGSLISVTNEEEHNSLVEILNNFYENSGVDFYYIGLFSHLLSIILMTSFPFPSTDYIQLLSLSDAKDVLKIQLNYQTHLNIFIVSRFRKYEFTSFVIYVNNCLV